MVGKKTAIHVKYWDELFAKEIKIKIRANKANL